MTHRAEDILDALETQLTGLLTTASYVYRGYDQVLAVPALQIKMGVDAPIDSSVQKVDRTLAIDIEVYVKASESTDSELNQVRAEAYAALMAQPQLGLTFVVNTDFENDGAPDQRDNTSPIVKQTLNYAVHYRHSYLSAEN